MNLDNNKLAYFSFGRPTRVKSANIFNTSSSLNVSFDKPFLCQVIKVTVFYHYAYNTVLTKIRTVGT